MRWTATLALLAAVAVWMIPTSFIHSVDEGYVGIYYYGGRLLEDISPPGYHFKSPLTSARNVFVSMQTDAVRSIPCGTIGGVMLEFDKIEVVNRLKHEHVFHTVKNYTVDYDQTWIFDKLAHSLLEFCSVHTLDEVYITKFDQLDEELAQALQRDCDQWAPGIEIIAVRVTKPRLPASIEKNYRALEEVKSNYLVASNTQKVVKKKAETALKQAVLEAEKQKAVRIIDMEQEVSTQEQLRELWGIEDEMNLAREKAHADAEYYAAVRENQGDRLLFTPAYSLLQQREAMLANATLILGDKIPDIMVGGGSGLLDPTNQQ